MWHGWDKDLDGELITLDRRQGDYSYQGPKVWAPHDIHVKPLILADLSHLPFRCEVFDWIIWDPPHLEITDSCYMGRYYGSWSSQENVIYSRASNLEFSRVLKQSGIIIVKSNPKRFNTIRQLLPNFRFIFPIMTGTGARGQGISGAIWAIGVRLN